MVVKILGKLYFLKKFTCPVITKQKVIKKIVVRPVKSPDKYTKYYKEVWLLESKPIINDSCYVLALSAEWQDGWGKEQVASWHSVIILWHFKCYKLA